MLVRIEKNWNFPDIFRQTPNFSKFWDGIEFTDEKTVECDYLIVLNFLENDVKVNCPPSNIWCVIQEPYIRRYFSWIKYGHANYSRVYTHYIPSNLPKYIISNPLLPWHINKSFDELSLDPKINKQSEISCIASSLNLFPGHKKRINFLEYLKTTNLLVDYFGKGINEVKDKYDALAKYNYSIAIENDKTNFYWTEKISDCFLSDTMPIYYGCENITDFFPEESLILIDIERPDFALEIIQKAIKDKKFQKNFKYIQEAKKLLLNKYQFFPFISNEIKIHNNEQLNSKINKVERTINKYEENLLIKLLKRF